MPTVHGNLGADVGASNNIRGLQPPYRPAGAISDYDEHHVAM